MRHLSARDRAALEALRRSLDTLDLREADAAPWLPALRDLLGSERALVFGVRPEETGASIAFARGAGFVEGSGPEMEAELDAWVRGASGAFSYYDPVRPHRVQRNVAVDVGTWHDMANGQLPRLLEGLPIPREERDRRMESLQRGGSFVRRWSFTHHHQLRALLCEGPYLLAWVGVMRSDPHDLRAKELLRALVPTIQRRIAVEARLRVDPPIVDPLAAAVLEHVAGEAFVIDGAGRVVLANSRARLALVAERAQVLESLRACARGRRSGRFAVTAIEGRGQRPLWLALQRAPVGRPGVRDAAVRRFALTPREGEVLSWLLRGATNASIAANLGCSERTIEVHVGRILEKTGSPSRAAVVARVLTLDCG